MRIIENYNRILLSSDDTETKTYTNMMNALEEKDIGISTSCQSEVPWDEEVRFVCYHRFRA